MLSSFVDWIVFSSSSSSSSSSRYDHEDNDQVIISAETEDNDEKNDVILDDVAANGDTIPVGIAVTDASAAVTVAVPATEALIHDHPPPITTTIINGRKRRRIDYDEDDDDILMAAQEEKKHLDDSRRPSHRLWTNEDEIQLLQGYLEHTTSRGNAIHHNDTALFYEQIGSKLQVVFNKNQLLDKLRRLKRKYLNALEKINSEKEFSFKSAHDQAAFEISRKIWGDTRRMDKPGVEENTLDDGHDQLSPTTLNHLNLVDVKVENDEVLSDLRLRKRTKSGHASKNRLISNHRNYGNNNDDVEDNNIDNGNATRLIEDTVRSCLSPWFKELLSNAFCPMPLSDGTLQGESTMNLQREEQVDEKGREQRILELERYSKQLELVQDRIKVALQELRSNIRE